MRISQRLADRTDAIADIAMKSGKGKAKPRPSQASASDVS